MRGEDTVSAIDRFVGTIFSVACTLGLSYHRYYFCPMQIFTKAAVQCSALLFDELSCSVFGREYARHAASQSTGDRQRREFDCQERPSETDESAVHQPHANRFISGPKRVRAADDSRPRSVRPHVERGKSATGKLDALQSPKPVESGCPAQSATCGKFGRRRRVQSQRGKQSGLYRGHCDRPRGRK